MRPTHSSSKFETATTELVQLIYYARFLMAFAHLRMCVWNLYFMVELLQQNMKTCTIISRTWNCASFHMRNASGPVSMEHIREVDVLNACCPRCGHPSGRLIGDRHNDEFRHGDPTTTVSRNQQQLPVTRTAIPRC